MGIEFVIVIVYRIDLHTHQKKEEGQFGQGYRQMRLASTSCFLLNGSGTTHMKHESSHAHQGERLSRGQQPGAKQRARILSGRVLCGRNLS